MSETAADYTPGRSLFAELTELREQITSLRTTMLQVVDLQREIHTKLDTALNVKPINGVSRSHTFDTAQVA